MSKQAKREILAIAETMAVEAGQAKGHPVPVDVLIGQEHKARVEWTPRIDRLDVATTRGHFLR